MSIAKAASFGSNWNVYESKCGIHFYCRTYHNCFIFLLFFKKSPVGEVAYLQVCAATLGFSALVSTCFSLYGGSITTDAGHEPTTPTPMSHGQYALRQDVPVNFNESSIKFVSTVKAASNGSKLECIRK